jgi:hypothetical protein
VDTRWFYTRVELLFAGKVGCELGDFVHVDINITSIAKPDVLSIKHGCINH